LDDPAAILTQDWRGSKKPVIGGTGSWAVIDGNAMLHLHDTVPFLYIKLAVQLTFSVGWENTPYYALWELPSIRPRKGLLLSWGEGS
jgi:hypothetical protein